MIHTFQIWLDLNILFAAPIRLLPESIWSRPMSEECFICSKAVLQIHVYSSRRLTVRQSLLFQKISSTRDVCNVGTCKFQTLHHHCQSMTAAWMKLKIQRINHSYDIGTRILDPWSIVLRAASPAKLAQYIQALSGSLCQTDELHRPK